MNRTTNHHIFHPVPARILIVYFFKNQGMNAFYIPFS